jgi:hypothetical protein
VLLATFMFAVPLSSPWWSTALRREIPGESEEDGDLEAAPSPGDPSSGATAVPGSTLKVTLHTRLKDRTGLATVEREIPYSRGILPQIRATVAELALPSSEGPPLLPEGTAVLDVAYSRDGTVYIDFSAPLEASRGVGAEEERVLVQGIVTTVADNFSAVRRVVILVEGKAPKPGHLDLTRALGRDDPAFSADEDTGASPDPEGRPPVPVPTPAPAMRATPGPVQASPKPQPSPPPVRAAPTPVAGDPISRSQQRSPRGE